MYKTGNPVPSAALEDMADNAQVFDALVTKTEGTTTDRLGRTRRVFQQILMDMGFQPLAGSFQTGATITARNQTLYDEASHVFYAWGGTIPVGGYVVPVGSTPATAGGVGVGLWSDKTDLMLRSELISQDGSSKVGFKQAGAGAVATNVQAKLRETVSVKDFGAVGDDSDETTKLTNALTAAAGNTIQLEPGKVYRSTAALVVPANTTLELNGSKIKFVVTGSANCLDLRDGVTVRNGAVELAGSGYTGHGGNGCPIIVGDYGSGTGYDDIRVENITITSNKEGGNAFLITGDSRNIILENIEIPGPTVIGSYGCHWGGANDPTAGTTHPHNIVMRNIKMGTSTHATAIGAMTSGCYDVLMENLVFDQMTQHCVYVFCGDYGMEFAADANIRALGIHNIKIKNVTGKRVGYPVYVDMLRNVAPATPKKERCTNVVFENCSFFGNDPTNANRFGFRLRYTDNVVMDSCVFKNFYNAGRMTFSSNDNTFRNCEFSFSWHMGVMWTITGETNSTPSQRNTFENCLFKDNNQRFFASVADIYLQWGGYNTIKDCKFDSPLMPWNVRTGTGDTASFGNVVTGNLIVSAPTSACFSFGSDSDYWIVDLFAGNRMANKSMVPLNGFVDGQLLLPFDTTPRAGQNRVARKLAGAAIPTGGLWTVGDTIFFNTPTAAGNIGAVCVTEGTPGTWKTFGAIAA